MCHVEDTIDHISRWIPALDGVWSKLVHGAKVADVGCSHGASTIVLAQAFPKSRFLGFDADEAAIERARTAAERAGVAERVRFEVASPTDYPGRYYDLVAVSGCLDDTTDAVGAAAHAHETLDEHGTLVIVEPRADERRLRRIAMQGGFTRVRRATQIPFDLVRGARP